MCLFLALSPSTRVTALSIPGDLAMLAVQQFGIAVAGGEPEDIQAAIENVLKVSESLMQRRLTRVTGRLSNSVIDLARRVEKLEEQVKLHQRHLKMIDLIEDTRAREN